MFFKAALLIILGILCLIITVISIIFSVISFANNKSGKFIWLTAFLVGFIGLIICVIMAVNKVKHAVSDLTENTISKFENYSDSLSYLNSDNNDTHKISHSSAQIKLLKSYLPSNIVNNEPEEFYTYSGFKDYYRYPLRYPYSIHCTYTKDNGELYNEVNVTRFDENDNGEIFKGLGNINKFSFDKHYLLVEQAMTSTRTDKVIYHYILFDLDNEKKEEAASLQKLLQLAKTKGYEGSDTLITVEQYEKLFN